MNRTLIATCALSAAFLAPGAFAQATQTTTSSSTTTTTVQDSSMPATTPGMTAHQLDKAHDANKAQAKADKAEAKALRSHKVRKAERKQEKADQKIDDAMSTPR